MAALSRFERRNYAEAFLEFYDKALPEQRGTRLLLSEKGPYTAFLFLLLPFDSTRRKLKDYRRLRRAMLQDYCLINKYLNNSIIEIVAIGAKTRDENQFIDDSFFDEGQDFMYINFEDWTDNDQANVAEIYNIYKKKKIFAPRQLNSSKSHEFPIVQNNRYITKIQSAIKGNSRNKPFICGIGKKVKKCLGRLLKLH